MVITLGQCFLCSAFLFYHSVIHTDTPVWDYPLSYTQAQSTYLSVCKMFNQSYWMMTLDLLFFKTTGYWWFWMAAYNHYVNELWTQLLRLWPWGYQLTHMHIHKPESFTPCLSKHKIIEAELSHLLLKPGSAKKNGITRKCDENADTQAHYILMQSQPALE